MKLHLRAVAVIAIGASLGTAACYQLSGLDDYDDSDGGTDASALDASPGVDAAHDAAADAAPSVCANNACNIACNDFSKPPSGLTCVDGFSVESSSCEAGATCSPYPQCGCGVDSTCQLTDGIPTCVAAGALPVHSPCSGGGCQVGLTCVDSVCLAFSDSVGSVCATGDSPTAVPGSKGEAFVCLPTCDPLTTDVCPTAHTNCNIAADFYLVTACVTAGAGGAGSACNSVPTSCRQGLVCTGSGASAACRAPVALDADCGAGAQLTPFSASYDAGFGYCVGGDGG